LHNRSTDYRKCLSIFEDLHIEILETVEETERANIEAYNSEQNKRLKPLPIDGAYFTDYKKYDVCVRFVSVLNAFEYMKEAEKVFPEFQFIYTLEPEETKRRRPNDPIIHAFFDIVDHRFD